MPQSTALLKAHRNSRLRLYDRVSNYADQVDVNLKGSPNAEDFARLCTHLEFIELREHAGGERWSDDGSREKLALKFYLSQAIALSTPDPGEIPQHYIDFVSDITPNDVVVTFNWDLLLEKAIIRSGGGYSYSFQEGKIHILKLHGSVHWLNNAPKSFHTPARDFNYTPLGFAEGFAENEVYASDELFSREAWTGAQALVDQVKPLIVLPGFGKAFDVRQLAALWYRIEILNIRHGGVSIIGLNVSDDDFVVESLFRYVIRGIFSDEREIRVINPDPDVGLRFQRFAGDRTVNFVQEKFMPETVTAALLI